MSSTSRTVTIINDAPTISVAPSATPSPVTQTTTSLHTLGADFESSELELIYTWTATTLPALGTFNAVPNGTNAAKDATAVFTKSGTYTLQLKVQDPNYAIATATLTVDVIDSPQSMLLTPGSISLPPGAQLQFSVRAVNQFGSDMLLPSNQLQWTSSSGGTVDSSGNFTAGLTQGLVDLRTVYLPTGKSGTARIVVSGGTFTDANFNGISDATDTLLGITGDWDGDQLSGIQEQALGTSPFARDTDHDGYDDNVDAFPLDPTRHLLPVNTDASLPVIVQLFEPKLP